MRRRNLDPNTPETPAGNHAFEHLLIDPMNADEEEDKDRQFVTALARGLELLRCFTPAKACWVTRSWRARPGCQSRRLRG